MLVENLQEEENLLGANLNLDAEDERLKIRDQKLRLKIGLKIVVN